MNCTCNDEFPVIPPDVVEWCPFCGGSPRFERLGGPKSTHYTVSCSKCKCDLHYYVTLDLAIAAWNQRVENTCPATQEEAKP